MPLIRPAVLCPLPNLSHLRREDYQAVYEPSDDTFLLLDALASDIACLRAQLPGICLELGSGSGAVITGLSQILSRAGVPGSAAALMATDLNPTANAASARTAAVNGASVQVRFDSDSGAWRGPCVSCSSARASCLSLTVGEVGTRKVAHLFAQARFYPHTDTSLLIPCLTLQLA
jgi:hypothetical protein